MGALLATLCACKTSPSVGDFLPAVEPGGIRGDLTAFDRRPVRVELLAVDDSSYIVLSRDRVAVVPFRAVQKAVFAPIGTTTTGGRAPSPDHRSQLTYASRFPYGIPAPVMARLLEKAGQQRPDDFPAAAGTAARDPDVAEFVARAREGTSRYRDQQAAINAGFRRIGVDFPAMGEHWVSLHRIMADRFDAASPSILTYVRVGGVPTLAGVAYTALLEPRESLPSFSPAAPFWHEHNGTVVEESFPLDGHATPPEPGEAHLAILHAWVWTENPAGVFTTDNWSLPYMRAGVPAPRVATAELAGALSLGAGAADYYLLAARNAGRLSDAETLSAERLVRAEAVRMTAHVERLRARRALEPADERELVERWRALWVAVAAVAPDRAASIRALAHAGDRAHEQAHSSRE
jgi:hypothetical protein